MTEPMTEPNNDRTEPVSDSVLAEATEWYCRVEAAPYDDALREELEAWLAADERHARAWGLTARAWEASGGVRAEFAHLWENPEPVAGPRAGPGRASWRRRAAFAAAALAACLVLAVALPDLLLRAGADIHTGAGETREIALEDGSVVHLGADSAISVAFTPDRRGLKLLHGEAFFRVAKNGVRPFVVGAEDLSVTVTGTAFDVAFTDRTFSVAVEEGSVRAATGSGEAVALAGGERMTVDRHSGRIARGRAAAGDVAAWRNGRMVVENAAVADVVDTIRRYHSGAIVIAGGPAAGRRVTGVYDLDHPERALRALVGPYGGVVRSATPWLLIVTDF